MNSSKNRKSVLEKLSKSQNKQAQLLLNKEFARQEAVLSDSDKFGDLFDALETLNIFAFRVHDSAIPTLISVIDRLHKTELELEGHQDFDFYTPDTLIEKAVHILGSLRYMNTASVFDALLELSFNENEKTREGATSEIVSIAEIDLSILQSIGVQPQLIVLNGIEKLSREQVVYNSEMIFQVLNKIFDSNIDTSEWGYSEVTIRKAVVPAFEGTIVLRSRALELTKSYYYFDDSISWQKQVLQVLNSAMYLFSRGDANENTLQMISDNAVAVLAFFKELIPNVKYQIVQKIEHDAYWEFYHAPSKEVEEAALAIEIEISKIEEYEIYRDLVGFEGVFGDWAESKAGESKFSAYPWKNQDQLIYKYLDSIAEGDIEEWFNRLIVYCETESDDMATFPRLYSFSEKLGEKFPREMLKLLFEHQQESRKIQISVLIGVWNTEIRGDVKSVLASYCKDAEEVDIALRVLAGVEEVEADYLESILREIPKSEDAYVLTLGVVVLMTHHLMLVKDELNNIFINLVDSLSGLKDTNWINGVWYRKDLSSFYELLSEASISAILDNIIDALRIDHHFEEVLLRIGKKDVSKVIEFFRMRLEHKQADDLIGYEAIPYSFYSLSEVLAGDAHSVVSQIRSWFDGNLSAFIHRGAKLLTCIYPEIDTDLQNELLAMSRTEDVEDKKFVLAILRAYNGQSFSMLVFVELVKSIAEEDDLLESLKIAFESSGVLHGAFGYSSSLQAKVSQLEELQDLPDPEANAFIRTFIAELRQRMEIERQREEDEVAQRKHKYGVDEDASEK